MASRQRVLVFCLCAAFCIPHAFALSPTGANALAERFLSRDEPPLERYRARRLMRARNARFNLEASLEATTQLDPVTGFTFDVVATRGSSYLLKRVLLPSLQGEAEMWQRGDPQRNGLTPENYQFLDTVRDEGGTPEEVRIPVSPRRTHLLLVEGSLVVSPRDADLLRVEGRVSKSPSFWISRIDVVRRYARLGGVRVPVELESVAHVRIAGRSELQIVYLYESVNGTPVEPVRGDSSW